MGYGIELLNYQPIGLPMMIDVGCELPEYVKAHIRRIHEANARLYRLSSFTISFIGECDKLFNICKVDDDDGGDFWGWVYTWRGKYCRMEWEELKIIIEQLADEYYRGSEDYDEEDTVDCLYDLEILFSVTDITRTFRMT
jgi:hypothetical protein